MVSSFCFVLAVILGFFRSFPISDMKGAKALQSGPEQSIKIFEKLNQKD
jgi:hypothetical protein